MQTINGNNLARVKVTNQAAIREIIYYYGPISRGEISERLDLTLPTITTTINALLAKGVIREVSFSGATRKSMGRRVSYIDVADDARLFLGIEIRGTCRHVCLTNYRGHLLGALSDENPQMEYQLGLETALSLAQQLLHQLNLTVADIAGIGVCSPGLVDTDNGILKMHPGYGWKDKSVCRDIARGLDYQGPVVMDNNVCARACGMRLFHQDLLKDARNFTYLFVSQGIACPFVQNTGGPRISYTGAGEVGHMVMKPFGPLCSCGNRGCLEAFSSERAIIARCREAMSQDQALILREICADPLSPTVAEILSAQEQGDIHVMQILDTAILYLGIAIANIYNFVAPQRMVIDCALFASEENRAKLLESIHANLYTGTVTDVHFTFVDHDEGSGAIGAAALAIQHDLQSYIEVD